jgi:outer membrane receptor protein involved in Fe transport
MSMKKTALATAVTALLAPAPFAWAQNAGNAELQTITITSQKRKEDIREVPLSVSVMSGDAMQDGHVSDFSDLSRAIPNLSFSTQAGAGLATLQLRGVSSQAGSATVSIYLDDISLTTRNLYSQGTAEPRFFDVERVEVLRGPQGTLYGASSLGGTIKFISKQPDATRFEGGAYGELSSTSHGGTSYNLQGVLNVPLSKDVLGLRVGVQSGKSSGYIDQVDVNTLGVTAKGINQSRWDVVKLSAKALLSKDWTLTPAVFYQRFKSSDIDAAYETVGDYQSANVGKPLAQFQTSKIVREPGTDTLTVPSATLNGDVGFGDLTAIVSGYQRQFNRVQDGTSINTPYIGSVVTDPALGTVVGFLPSAVDLNNKIDQTSVELRLASKDYKAGGTPWTWIGGFYAAKTKTEVFDNEPVFGINAAFTAAGRNIEDPAELADTFPGAFLGDSSYYSARHYNDKQNSVFGEVTYHAGPSLRLLAGLRLVRASQHFTREGDRYYAGGPTTALIDSSASASTPRFAVDWDVDKYATVYANVAKGFRLGSANRPVPDTALVRQDLTDLKLPPLVPAAFKPDSLWSYEAGTKLRLLGGSLAFSAAAFYIDWKDIQQDVVLPNSGFDFETNVGAAKSYGLEFETQWRASEALTVNVSGGWTKAVFKQTTEALGQDSSGRFNAMAGDSIQGVPKYNAALGFEYRFAAFGSNSAFVRASGQWTGASRGDLNRESPDFNRPSYFTADASTGLTLDRWELTAFVKNALNNDLVLQRPNVQGVSTVYHLRPRTIGLTARYDF